MKKIHFFLVPLGATLVSLLYQNTCTEGYCFYMGRGFPLGFYDMQSFVLNAFLIDLIFFFIIYALILFLVKWMFRKK